MNIRHSIIVLFLSPLSRLKSIDWIIMSTSLIVKTIGNFFSNFGEYISKLGFSFILSSKIK